MYSKSQNDFEGSAIRKSLYILSLKLVLLEIILFRLEVLSITMPRRTRDIFRHSRSLTDAQKEYITFRCGASNRIARITLCSQVVGECLRRAGRAVTLVPELDSGCSQIKVIKRQFATPGGC